MHYLLNIILCINGIYDVFCAICIMMDTEEFIFLYSIPRVLSELHPNSFVSFFDSRVWIHHLIYYWIRIVINSNE